MDAGCGRSWTTAIGSCRTRSCRQVAESLARRLQVMPHAVMIETLSLRDELELEDRIR
jgi:hypothetical protein